VTPPRTDYPTGPAAGQSTSPRCDQAGPPPGRLTRMLRSRQAVLLVTPLVRAVSWWPLGVAIALSLLALLPTLRHQSPYAALLPLRLAAIMLGGAAAFAMVDQMAPMTVAPTPRWLRQWLRLVLALLPATACWVALAALARSVLGPDAIGPSTEVAVEATVCALIGVSAAAVAARHRHTATGELAGPMAQALLATATLFLPDAWSPWLSPDFPAWPTVHRYWLACLPILAVILFLANRETGPGRRRIQLSGAPIRS
jgi:hypothetical protein